MTKGDKFTINDYKYILKKNSVGDTRVEKGNVVEITIVGVFDIYYKDELEYKDKQHTLVLILPKP